LSVPLESTLLIFSVLRDFTVAFTEESNVILCPTGTSDNNGKTTKSCALLVTAETTMALRPSGISFVTV
jgi:hypothetical protein